MVLGMNSTINSNHLYINIILQHNHLYVGTVHRILQISSQEYRNCTAGRTVTYDVHQGLILMLLIVGSPLDLYPYINSI